MLQTKLALISDYLFSVTDTPAIDSAPEGNITRFINDRCETDPNTIFVCVRIFQADTFYIHARREICGEEFLSISYCNGWKFQNWFCDDCIISKKSKE